MANAVRNEVDGFFMLCLLNDGGIVGAASPETALNEKAMQIGERRNRGARQADTHVGANHRIQHPRRNDGHEAR
ncbi:MAG: hypothetical protein OXU70_06275 [Gammaproteobacteria bacterium]|nr:hypothetical protein [Gammaproteobacteria bacterium]